MYATMLCSNDINGDGVVDVADLQLLAAMAAGGDYGRCDLNGDGKVNGADFGVVLKAILKAGPVSSLVPALRGSK
jgi:hypothetical protein